MPILKERIFQLSGLVRMWRTWNINVSNPKADHAFCMIELYPAITDTCGHTKLLKLLNSRAKLK